MKLTIQKISYILIILIFAVSCGGTTSSESEEHEHAEGVKLKAVSDQHQGATKQEHNEGEDLEAEPHKHAGGMAESMMSKAFTWMPTEEPSHMFAYKTDNVMMMKHGDDNVMMFSPKGDKSSCMFNGKQGNVGVTATIKLDGIDDGEVKLIHHSIDKDNYEFVALKGNMMNLGRVEKGEEKILDAKEVQLPTGWFTLTVTAAGTHFKGYLNDKMMTHGHAQEMPAGHIGIMSSGDGSMSVKKIEVTPLEAEH